MTGVLHCWFCTRPATSVGWGFAVCDQGRHAERARLLGNPALTNDQRTAVLAMLDEAEARDRAGGRA